MKELTQSISRAIQDSLSGWHQEANKHWSRAPAEKRLQIQKSGVGLLTGLVAIGFITAVGIYGLGWQNSVSHLVSKVIPYPSAFVGSQGLRYSVYMDEVRSITKRGLKPGADVNRQAMGKLVNQAVIEDLARDLKVKLPSEEINKEVASFYKAYGDKKRAAQAIRDDYGMSEAEFKKAMQLNLLVAEIKAALGKDAEGEYQRRLLEKLKYTRVIYLLPQTK